MSIILEPCKWTYIGGKLLPSDRASLPADNHALHYGTAAFESLRVYRTPSGSKVVGLPQHLERLRSTMASLAIAPVDEGKVLEGIRQTIAANALDEGYLRILAYPSGSCTRLDPGAHQSDILIVSWRVSGARYAPPISLGIAPVRRPPAGSTLPRAKHSGMYGIYAATHAAARSQGFDDALVLHSDGTICEITGANIFMVRDGEIFTPFTPHSIDGVTRHLVMQLAGALGMPVREAILALEDLSTADEIFLTGTFHGIRPVRAVASHAPRMGAPGPVTRALQQGFDAMLAEEGALADIWLSDVATERRESPAAANGQIRVRPALRDDVPLLLGGIRSLLEELRGVPGIQLPEGARAVCERIVDGRSRGTIFAAFPAGREDQLVGLLSITIQDAIHFGGSYALIQYLWVHPEYRSHGVGAALMGAVEAYCRDHKLPNLEVGLPSLRFQNLPRTYNFYQENGFVELGPRMRKEVV